MGCIELPLRMASAVNYLMTLQLTAGFGAFVFFKLKLKKKKSNFNETLLDSFSSLWNFISSSITRKKKKRHVNHGVEKKKSFPGSSDVRPRDRCLPSGHGFCCSGSKGG